MDRLNQPEFDGMSNRDIIESMVFEDRIRLKHDLLETASEIERVVHLINDVNEAEGHSEDEEQDSEMRHMLGRGAY